MNKLHNLDEYLAKQVSKLSQNLLGFFGALTRAGNASVIGIIAAITVLSLRGHEHYSSAVLVLLFLPVGFAIKFITRRTRPDTIYVQKMRFAHYSFPSGHAYGTLLVYGFLAFLAASWPIYILASLLIFLIGLSRVYLGAHFPTDVLGGWVLAGVVLILALAV